MLLLLVLCFLCFDVQAKNLGIYGETFEIAEKDILLQIKERLISLQQNGQLELLQKDIQNKVIKSLLNPVAINIKHTQISRDFTYDPSIEVTMDLKDHNGVIFAKKGERYNPLDYVRLSKALLFIDGTSEDHIKWALSKGEKYNTKVILTNGSPMDLRERFRFDIYFDQHGNITKKLGISQVPAIARQIDDEKVLTISEELPDEI